MIDRDNVLPLTRQAGLLRLSRSSVYYLPRPVPPARLAIMRRVDELHLEHPFAGSRILRDLLRREGITIGRLAVATLMRRMGIEALYRWPSTSKPAPGHKIYPYLLRNLVVDRPNQVWAMDITYIPMARGFVYLAAVVDWFSRQVLAWRLSITLETEFCLDIGEHAPHDAPLAGPGFETHLGARFARRLGGAVGGVVVVNVDRRFRQHCPEAVDHRGHCQRLIVARHEHGDASGCGRHSGTLAMVAVALPK